LLFNRDACTLAVGWQHPKMCELNGFEPQASGDMQGNKAIQLDFWAAFLWYFLLLQKESTEKTRKDNDH